MVVYINGKRLNPSKLIGSGGEADIFDIGDSKVLKLFKQPDHPDFAGMPFDQEAARRRLEEHQLKLPSFPKNLPSRVVSPIDLATNKGGSKILGYSMEFLKGYEVLLKYSNKSYRQMGVSDEDVVNSFKDLHNTVYDTHKVGVIINDFNDLNIMVKGSVARIIDADSFQFGKFLSQVFTEKFVDPMLCDPMGNRPVLNSPHNTDSDWYAFAVMLMQSLLFVGPYGGVYRPKDKTKLVPHPARPLKRITVFHPDVKYPKPARKYDILPDDLLQHFHQVFVEDKRGVFPRHLLDINWTKCPKCGAIHAKSVCPSCSHYIPSTVVETVRGNVTCKRAFRTSGMILFADMQVGALKYLYHDGTAFTRENGSIVVRGNILPSMRFRIRGNDTIIGDKNRLLVISQSGNINKLAVDVAGTLPLFDSNGTHIYWVDDGRLLKDGKLGPEYIGDVLTDRTLFWVGTDFGFGFYKAGNFNAGFVFDAQRSGINDSVKIPPMPGQLIDSKCYFAGNWCWFLYSMREKGKSVNRCLIIKSDGSTHQQAEATSGDGSWLGSIRGKCAAGKFLLSPTDDGIVRVEPDGNTIKVVKEFPDTEPFIDSSYNLFAGVELFAVSRNEIKTLKIA